MKKLPKLTDIDLELDVVNCFWLPIGGKSVGRACQAVVGDSARGEEERGGVAGCTVVPSIDVPFPAFKATNAALG